MCNVLFEIKKIKGIGLLAGMFILTVAVVWFMGYAGYVEDHIAPNVVHITALSIFSEMLLPIFLSAIVIRNYSIEKKEDGFVNCIVKGIPVRKIYNAKLMASYLLGCLFTGIAFVVAAVFVWMKGQNPLVIYLVDYQIIVLFVMGIVSVVNITYIISLLTGNGLISGIVAIVATIFESFTNYTGIQFINPWGFFEAALFYRGLGIMKELLMLAVTILSTLFVISVMRKNEKNILK